MFSGLDVRTRESGPLWIPTTITCRHCGVIDKPVLADGKGPHAGAARCSGCGRHIQWLSASRPEERQQRRAATAPATAAQLGLLADLGDKREAPATMAEASDRIARALKYRGYR